MSHSAVTRTIKAEILRKHLFDGVPLKELSQGYGVSPSAIRRWKSQFSNRFEAFYTSQSEKFETLCRELTALKKELGEL